ncbi:MAG TPA: hypothetical protein VMT00_16045 [Thermoanaerobaculia bacterium]|nr:hypothetical protein [Thermoanaerobaculia bacterium]
MVRFADLPQEVREKAVGDVFCIHCQKSYRLEEFTEREFRGTLIIEGKCPVCGGALARPVSTGIAH